MSFWNEDLLPQEGYWYDYIQTKIIFFWVAQFWLLLVHLETLMGFDDTIQISSEYLDKKLMVLEVLEDIFLSSKGCHVMVIACTFDQVSLEESRACEKGLKVPLEGICTQSTLEVRLTSFSGSRAGQNSFCCSRNSLEVCHICLKDARAVCLASLMLMGHFWAHSNKLNPRQ